jgi:hypothetical protein
MKLQNILEKNGIFRVGRGAARRYAFNEKNFITLAAPEYNICVAYIYSQYHYFLLLCVNSTILTLLNGICNIFFEKVFCFFEKCVIIMKNISD